MVLSWREGKLPPGEGEDANGDPLPDSTLKVNTLTGEVEMLPQCRLTGKTIAEEDPFNPGELLTVKIFMKPPILVWLYT